MARCIHGRESGRWCKIEATHLLFAPDGKPSPGSYVCGPHGDEIIAEYAAKLGEIWTALPLGGPCSPAARAGMAARVVGGDRLATAYHEAAAAHAALIRAEAPDAELHAAYLAVLRAEIALVEDSGENADAQRAELAREEGRVRR